MFHSCVDCVAHNETELWRFKLHSGTEVPNKPGDSSPSSRNFCKKFALQMHVVNQLNMWSYGY